MPNGIKTHILGQNPHHLDKNGLETCMCAVALYTWWQHFAVSICVQVFVLSNTSNVVAPCNALVFYYGNCG